VRSIYRYAFSDMRGLKFTISFKGALYPAMVNAIGDPHAGANGNGSFAYQVYDKHIMCKYIEIEGIVYEYIPIKVTDSTSRGFELRRNYPLPKESFRIFERNMFINKQDKTGCQYISYRKLFCVTDEENVPPKLATMVGTGSDPHIAFSKHNDNFQKVWDQLSQEEKDSLFSPAELEASRANFRAHVYSNDYKCVREVLDEIENQSYSFVKIKRNAVRISKSDINYFYMPYFADHKPLNNYEWNYKFDRGTLHRKPGSKRREKLNEQATKDLVYYERDLDNKLYPACKLR